MIYSGECGEDHHRFVDVLVLNFFNFFNNDPHVLNAGAKLRKTDSI